MENSIEFFLNTHIEWSLSRQDLVITIIESFIEENYQGGIQQRYYIVVT